VVERVPIQHETRFAFMAWTKSHGITAVILYFPHGRKVYDGGLLTSDSRRKLRGHAPRAKALSCLAPRRDQNENDIADRGCDFDAVRDRRAPTPHEYNPSNRRGDDSDCGRDRALAARHRCTSASFARISAIAFAASAKSASGIERLVTTGWNATRSAVMPMQLTLWSRRRCRSSL
jgi:hypothetical protein